MKQTAPDKQNSCCTLQLYISQHSTAGCKFN